MITYREAKQEDFEAIYSLLCSVRLTITRLTNNIAYRVFAREALSSKYLDCIVAEKDGEIVGSVILAHQWGMFKKLYLIKHPIIAIMFIGVVIRRTIVGRKIETPDIASVPDSRKRPAHDTRSWGDDDSDIAKVIEVSIHPGSQGHGIGRGLYTSMFDIMSQKGFSRIDAMADFDNLASVKLHERTGFTVYLDDTDYFAYKII